MMTHLLKMTKEEKEDIIMMTLTRMIIVTVLDMKRKQMIRVYMKGVVAKMILNVGGTTLCQKMTHQKENANILEDAVILVTQVFQGHLVRNPSKEDRDMILSK